MSDINDLRNELNPDEFESDWDVHEVRTNEVTEGRIFGLTAGERMILSVILFLAVSVLSVALLFATQTLVFH